jgi:type II secretory pathway pseudopilin PulG
MNRISKFKNQSGFTLIETLIYIAFLSLLMSSLLGVTFQAIASTDQINKKIILQQESNFISAKLDWALTGASLINLPLVNNTGSELKVNNNNFSPNVLDFNLISGSNYLTLARGTNPALQLNSQNTKVTSFNVTASKIGSQPEQVQISFTVTLLNDPTQSQSFQLTKFLKQ